MPALTHYDPLDLNQLDELAKAELAARREAIAQRWACYRGDFKRPLKVRTGQADDNIIVNMVKRVVNQSVHLLFGEAPRIDLPLPGNVHAIIIGTERAPSTLVVGDERFELTRLRPGEHARLEVLTR